MATNPSTKWNPRRLRPRHLMVLQLHWSLLSNDEIAIKTGYTPQQISNIITSNEGQEILQQLSDQTIDSYTECNQVVQAALPAILDEAIQLALTSKDEKVRSVNCHKLMGIGGLSEVKRLHVEMADETVNKYRDKSDAELRNALLNEIGVQIPSTQTIH